MNYVYFICNMYTKYMNMLFCINWLVSRQGGSGGRNAGMFPSRTLAKAGKIRQIYSLFHSKITKFSISGKVIADYNISTLYCLQRRLGHESMFTKARLLGGRGEGRWEWSTWTSKLFSRVFRKSQVRIWNLKIFS